MLRLTREPSGEGRRGSQNHDLLTLESRPLSNTSLGSFFNAFELILRDVWEAVLHNFLRVFSRDPTRAHWGPQAQTPPRLLGHPVVLPES